MKKKTKFLIIILILIGISIAFSIKSYGILGARLSWEGLADGIVGVLLYPARLFPLLLGGIINIVLGLATTGTGLTCSIEDVVFGKVDITNINFFSNSLQGTSQTIASNVAIWYTSLRNVAIVALVIIAIYVGIKMALSTVAEDQAKYKKMLIDWLTSLALLFVLHYIMMLIIGINDALVSTLSTALTNSGSQDTKLSNISNTLLTNSISSVLSFTEGTANAIGYLLLSALTLIFLMIYIKRMVTIAFLIIISPLVTITYAIDKMKDGRSQALDTWLKEFAYNILIQPFHCVSYLALGTVAAKVMSTGGLFNAIVGIVMLVFVLKSEDIVKHIFHFESQSMGSTIAQAAFMTTIFSKATSGAKSATGAAGFAGDVSRAKNTKSNPGATTTTARTTDPKDPGASQGNNNAQSQANSQSNQNSQGNSNGYSNTNPNKRNRRNKALTIGGYIARANVRAATRMAGIALGAATGDLKGVYSGFDAGNKIGKNKSDALASKHYERALAREFTNYSAGTSPEQAIQDAMDMYNGVKEPDRNNDDQMKYYRTVLGEASNLKNSGVSDEDMEKELRKTLQAVNDGQISEYDRPVQHFVSKNRMKNFAKQQTQTSSNESQANSYGSGLGNGSTIRSASSSTQSQSTNSENNSSNSSTTTPEPSNSNGTNEVSQSDQDMFRDAHGDNFDENNPYR